MEIMALEKRLYAIPAQLFTANGTTDGLITLASGACRFKVKQEVFLSANTLPNLDCIEVKRVISDTQLYVGPKGGNIDARIDISAYTTALTARISANEQKRPSIPNEEIVRAVYEEEPTVATRVVMVDKCGDKYGPDNPLPIAFDGTIQVGNVTIQDDDGDELAVNNDGSINVNIVNSAVDEGLVILHNEIFSVAASVETTVLTYSVITPTSRVFKIDVSGDNVALFRVKVNGSTIHDKRTYWGNGFNESFAFEQFDNGLKLLLGDVLTVTVIHNRPMLGSFEATVMYS